MTLGFAIPADELQATGSASTQPRANRTTQVPALTRLDLLFGKFGNAPQHVLLRKVITDLPIEPKP